MKSRARLDLGSWGEGGKERERERVLWFFGSLVLWFFGSLERQRERGREKKTTTKNLGTLGEEDFEGSFGLGFRVQGLFPCNMNPKRERNELGTCVFDVENSGIESPHMLESQTCIETGTRTWIQMSSLRHGGAQAHQLQKRRATPLTGTPQCSEPCENNKHTKTDKRRALTPPPPPNAAPCRWW